MERVRSAAEWLKQALDIPLFTVGETSFTLWSFLYLVILIVLLAYLSGLLKRWLVGRVLAARGMELGVRVALGSITRYLVMFFGLLIVLQSAGVNLSALTVVAGALGIGVGFGLQNIASDFVSGLIIMFERPVKVGDRVEVAGIIGDIIRISPRATSVVTNDNISIIVPNSEFIRSRVTNWSHMDRNVRLHIPVGVSYKSDPEMVRKLLLEVAAGHDGVLRTPPPDVIFIGFGNSSLDFELRVWTQTHITFPFILKSDLYFAIWNHFKATGIEIPYPQRDIHIRSTVAGTPSA